MIFSIFLTGQSHETKHDFRIEEANVLSCAIPGLFRFEPNSLKFEGKTFMCFVWFWVFKDLKYFFAYFRFYMLDFVSLGAISLEIWSPN